jgi:CheY-like chemotaxis protein
MSRLLVIEDDPGYQELITTLLSAHQLTVCSSAEEAKQHLERQAFDALICDISLFGMTGLAFLRELKERGLTSKMPVIMCSSTASPEDRKAAVNGGAAGFVTKPFEPETLTSLLKSLLG